MLILGAFLWFLERKCLPSTRIEGCVIENGVVDSRGSFFGEI